MGTTALCIDISSLNIILTNCHNDDSLIKAASRGQQGSAIGKTRISGSLAGPLGSRSNNSARRGICTGERTGSCFGVSIYKAHARPDAASFLDWTAAEADDGIHHRRKRHEHQQHHPARSEGSDHLRQDEASRARRYRLRAAYAGQRQVPGFVDGYTNAGYTEEAASGHLRDRRGVHSGAEGSGPEPPYL